jgi:hypothetical protein
MAAIKGRFAANYQNRLLLFFEFGLVIDDEISDSQ